MNKFVLWLRSWFYEDARLMLAAPDMLEALVQCRSVLRTLRAETENETAKEVIWNKMVLAEAAINKAGGPSKNR